MCNRRLIICILLVAIVAAAWPQVAHAGVGDIANSVLLNLLDVVRAALEFIGQLLKSAMNWMGSVLQSVISLQLTYGGPAVYAVWKIFRDMCNMLFIVLFIAVAFSTIFNSFLKNNPFSAKNALMGIIIAALVINFSLAIGQTIVWAGNYASQMVLTWMGPSNIGATVATSLNLPAIQVGQITSALPAPQVGDIPINQLTPSQQRIVQAWQAQPSSSTAGSGTSQALSNLRACLTANKQSADTCFKNATLILANNVAVAQNNMNAAAQQPRSAVQMITDAYSLAKSAAQNGWSGATLPARTDSAPLDSKTQIALILNALLTDFLLLVLVLSFGAVIVFMGVRIPAVWILLSFSAIAFFTIALPNSGVFKKWFGELLGWCIFSPLYLFVIYIGLFFISQSGSLTASFSNSQAPFAAAFANILFFLIAGFIFIGGAAMARSVAFKFSSSAGTAFGKIGGFFGVNEKDMYGIRTIAQRTPVINIPNVQALGERVQQIGGDIRAGLRGRAPKLFGTEEEALAAARERFGVRPGAAEAEKLQMTRIKDERTRIEGPLKQRLQALETLAAQAVNPTEREQYQKQIKQLKDQNTEQLRTLLRSGNRDTAFAAGEMLMEDDKMTPEELRAMGGRYARVSPTAMAAFVKRRDTALVKGVAKHKFKDAAELEGYLSLLSDPKQAEAYYKAAKSGKSKVLVLEVGGDMKLEKKSDGSAYTFSELAQREAPKFNSEDWLAAEDALEKEAAAARKNNPNWTVLDQMAQISPDFRDRYAERFFDPRAKAYMYASASKEQLKRLDLAKQYAETNEKTLKRNISQARRYAASEPIPEKPGESEKKEAKEEKAEKSEEGKKG